MTRLIVECGLYDADRTAHARAADAAVAARILGKILLVIVLGVKERRRVGDLGGDASEAGRRQPILVGGARRFGRALLFRRERIDGGTVLSPHVVPLAHPLRGIVVLPEQPEYRVVGR